MKVGFRQTVSLVLLVLLISTGTGSAQDTTSQQIPLPEHPRPDFRREQWVNLNGTWQFRFDSTNSDQEEGWYEAGTSFPKSITVPFPWGSPLSGVENKADIGWYRRSVTVPESWEGRRIFVVVGASDWRTTAWIDGEKLGTNQGGYTPFEFELTGYVEPGESHRLVFRVDDTPHPFKLEGKQGYGPARGIWQTPYLVARGEVPISTIHFTPDIDEEQVAVDVKLLEPAPSDLTLQLAFETGDLPQDPVEKTVSRGADSLSFTVPVPDPRLWTLDDPFLYEVEASLGGPDTAVDRIDTYFGMREISVVDLPGHGYPYIALNGKPVYLETALDQAYHPEGYYTFPSDEFMRNEILRSRRLGLNGMRIHVKIGIPRKLYWADRLGMLIMADVPNSWGQPTPKMKQEVETALRGMIERDYNHPSIFAWMPFNETWGLRTEMGDDKEVYAKETQEWVVSIYRLAKRLDPTRLVEDNSLCCGDGHTETDINSWHAYLPGWAWRDHLDEITKKSHPGSSFHYEEGYQQEEGTPLFNSEFGNVWGYEGSTGDVDWSWDYHRALNAFRRHPEVSGWLYTEHHDVINEWNGYYRYDRSSKITGLSQLVEGMSLRDLHSKFYISPDVPLSQEVETGTNVQVPLWASFMTGSGAHGDELTLDMRLYGWDDMGRKETYAEFSRNISFEPWMSRSLSPVSVTMPEERGVVLLVFELRGETGAVLHRNFTTFVVGSGSAPREEVRTADGETRHVFRIEADQFEHADWSLKQWNVLDGLKVNGAGHGYFEYQMPWPDDLAPEDIGAATFRAELSPKQLFGKDAKEMENIQGSFMRGEGTHDPSLNRNAYPMTDMRRYRGAVTVRVNGEAVGTFDLTDDSADHRGILSWHYQKRDGYLREAGSYGELIKTGLPDEVLERAAEAGELVIRLEVSEAFPRGLAIYGDQFGRYRLDPTVTFVEK